jgi:predicted permease
MNIFSTLRCWWNAIVHRSRTDDGVKEEFQFYIDSCAADLMQQGVEPDEAQRQARIALGRPETQSERYRDAVGLHAFDELGADIRYGLRSLGKNPAYATVAVLSLALGIGATTAMFSLIYATLIHPFPYAGADRIMNPAVIATEGPSMRWFAMSQSQFEVLKEAHSIESLLGFANGNAEITGGDLPEDVAIIYLTENANTFFGLPALMGRQIQPSDAKGGGQSVAVLNFRFWQRHFHGDPSVIGRTLRINDTNYTAVGVMPRSFAFNDTLGPGDVYLPMSLQRGSTNPPIRPAYVPWIKLKPNVSMAAADQELDAIVHQFAKENPKHFTKSFYLQLQPIVVPYHQKAGRTLTLLLAGVILLLAIGCANCSMLLLARGEARQHELAVRSAIGASRWRIIRQLLVEAFVISFAGATLGVVVSYWLAQLPLKLSPSSFPPESVIRINLPILAFSVGLALLCGLLSGLFPALRLSRPDLAPTMQANLRRNPGGGRKRRINALIAAQIALTLLLVATAGTVIGAFLHLMRVPLGYDPDHVLNIGIMLHTRNAKDWIQVQSRKDRTAFIDQVKQQIAAIPGVISVTVATDSTPPYSGIDEDVEVSGAASRQNQQGRVHFVSPEYFATLRIPFVKGRVWNQSENASGDSLAIVNQAFARAYWPGKDPIGQRLRFSTLKSEGPFVISSAGSADWRQVIGIVADYRNDGVDRPAAPAVYLPYTTYMMPYVQLDIRTQGEPLSYLRAVREAVQSIASDQQVSNGAYDLNEAVARDAQWTRQRLFSILFGFFSGLALLLALVGIFSVVSYSVAQRTAEFGVRIALGAPRTHILWIAAKVAAQSVVAGIAVGVTIDLFIYRLLTRWMNNSDLDSQGLLNAILCLAVCSAVACILPARRAVSVQPTEALRYE